MSAKNVVKKTSGSCCSSVNPFHIPRTVLSKMNCLSALRNDSIVLKFCRNPRAAMPGQDCCTADNDVTAEQDVDLRLIESCDISLWRLAASRLIWLPSDTDSPV